MTTPEQKLACSVIAQAIRDAMPKTYPEHYASRSDRQEARKEMNEARIFLTEEYGKWATSRSNWCSIAEYDGDSLRTKMLHAIKRYDEVWNNKPVDKIRLKPRTATA